MTTNDTIAPDPEAKAAELLEREPTVKRGRGRPKGSKTKRAEPAPEIELGPPTEAEIQTMSMLLGVLWALVAVRVGRLTPLDDEEQRQLGIAAVPVARKYANLLGGYEAEFGFLVVAGGLVMAHWPQPVPEADVEGAPVTPSDGMAPWGHR